MDKSLRQALRTLHPLTWHNGEFDPQELEKKPQYRVANTFDEYFQDPRGRLLCLVLRDPTEEQERKLLEVTRNIVRGYKEPIVVSHDGKIRSAIGNTDPKGTFFSRYSIRMAVVVSSRPPRVKELAEYLIPTGDPLDYDLTEDPSPPNSVLNLEVVSQELPKVELDFTPKRTLNHCIDSHLLADSLLTKRTTLESSPLSGYAITQEDYDQAVARWTQTRQANGLFSGIAQQ